ncbi:hypothetical protein MKW98_006153 [Papaver atlanticum]|uniref:F-box associated domain-containing protein n=1 Tax=Papaver atlanticum TaxID=357466 RepID=A0AAD4XXB4_9MAGN|nr:hypothetical protein MKW98_006153 [Papaver atlanticum]
MPNLMRRSRKKVVAFDLANEEFRLVSAPPCMEKLWNEHDCRLVALGRQLCLYMGDELRVEIWSLMKGGGSKETWCLEFDIDYEAVVGSGLRKLQPVLLRKAGEIVFLFAESVLYCYDPKTTILKMISNEASTEDFKAVEVIAHLNTFASLEAMGENSKRYTVCTPLDDVIDELDRVALSQEIDTTRFRLRNR